MVVVVEVVLDASFSSFSSSFVTKFRKSCKIFCLVWGMVRVLLRATKTSASSPILDSRNLSLSRKTSRLTSSSFESSSGLTGLELEDSVSLEGLISLLLALKIGEKRATIFVKESVREQDHKRSYFCPQLCILTSKWVLRTPLAGQNRLFLSLTEQKKLKESRSKSCRTCSKRGGK